MTDLDKLIDAVEAGEVCRPNRKAKWQDCDFEKRGYGYNVNANAAGAYNGSVDAFLALRAALLPMWIAHIKAGADGNPSRVVLEPLRPISGNPSSVTEWNGCPARAGLIAVLKAYRATERKAHDG